MLVDFIGNGISLDDVATSAGTISYEILTRLGGRLRREYRG
jgi:alanine racemase